MPRHTLQPNGRGRKLVIVVIIIVWVIMTMRTGPGWLTPTEIAFCALLLGQSSRRSDSISS
jgi:hypothetical protein